MDHPLRATGFTDGERDALARALAARHPARLERPPAGGEAFLAWCLWEAFRRTVVWVVDGPRTLDALMADLKALAAGREDSLLCFPARETARATHPDIAGDRLLTLQRCRQEPPPAIVATCVQAILQPTLAPEAVSRLAVSADVGQSCEIEDMTRRLEAAGYAFEVEVSAKGQACVRGGILDVWPPTDDWPARLEWDGSTLASIRRFDPADQRSIGRAPSIRLSPAVEADAGSGADLSSFLPTSALWAWSEPDRIAEHAEIFERAAADGVAGGGRRLGDLRERAAALFPRGQIELRPPGEAAAVAMEIRELEGVPRLTSALHAPFEPDVVERLRARFVEGLLNRARDRRPVVFCFQTAGARDRFREACAAAAPLPERALTEVAPLSAGFVVGAGRLTVVAESDLYGARRETRGRYERPSRRAAPAGLAGARVAEWTDIQPGELVVHVEHGIGRYLGIFEIEVSGVSQEVLSVEYAEGARLHVPVSQAHLLSRYVGIGRRRPELHRLGTARWSREKEAAETAVRDLAAAMLETQAARQALAGHAFAPDGPWHREFAATFPYAETDDQAHAIEDVTRDMESPRPMDRLICGDVGYGKTEVAMRAAFKAVMDGRQVAVLVPTTVLAQQHFDTFSARMAAFPVAVEMLSRFRTRAEQAAVLRGLREGAVDVVIGTHRLVQPDVAFKDLGLVIIDEEQRFGVEHKESLKQLRRMVDVLTLTATPIPRTLYLGLLGVRDMSVIQTPPQERLPIETIVASYDDALVRDALLRELNREGQVFYLHNRVQTIDAVRDRLVRLVPEARIVAAHGQMGERELSDIMHRFVRAEFDVLLCTTIIESGVDIPNVNTIVIDRADRFGVADLYQLRGRVGRYKHRAYAYLLLPRHGRLFDTARRRIQAIRRYSSLGAGFKLALQDLETRGAGNLLGPQQSGHINAVGFDLYCRLLQRTVARMKGETPPPMIDVRVALDFLGLAPSDGSAAPAATIPFDYIEDENQRLALYRRIAACATEREASRLRAELRDRFGPLPPPADRLLQIARVRVLAHGAGIQAVESEGEKIVLRRGAEIVAFGARLPRFGSADPDRRLEELIRLLKKLS